MPDQPRCGGSGRVRRWNVDHEVLDPCPGCPDCRPCENCGGRGVLPDLEWPTVDGPDCGDCDGTGVGPDNPEPADRERPRCPTCGSVDWIVRKRMPAPGDPNRRCPDPFHEPDEERPASQEPIED